MLEGKVEEMWFSDFEKNIRYLFIGRKVIYNG